MRAKECGAPAAYSIFQKPIRPLKQAPTRVQAAVLHILLQGYLPPGRRQDKRHRDVRASERSLEEDMQWRGRVQSSKSALMVAYQTGKQANKKVRKIL